MVADDPFTRDGLITSLSIEEWDPLFGAFGEESSRVLLPDLKPLGTELGYS
jgi:hypothetical protein